jgi:uncharacterized membrane protein SirB2
MDINKDQLLEIVPHYVAMLLLVFGILTVIGEFAGELGFWVEFALIVVIVFLYRPLVVRLGVAPSSWE